MPKLKSKSNKLFRISSILILFIFVGYLSFFNNYKASAATNVVTKYALSTSSTVVTLDVSVDPQGNAWVLYTDPGASPYMRIAKINGTTGAVATFSLAPALFRSEAAAYDQKGKYSILAISPNTAFFTVNNTPAAVSAPLYNPGDFFARLGKLDVDNNNQNPMLTFAGPWPGWSGASPKDDYISDLIAGPNGSIWFTLSGSEYIGHLDHDLNIPGLTPHDPDSHTIANNSLLPLSGPTGTAPLGLAKDSAGNMWFARTNRVDPLTKAIGKFNPAGNTGNGLTVTSYAGPSSNIFQPTSFAHADPCIEVANNKVFLTYSNSYTLTGMTTGGELVTMKNLSSDIAGATGVGCIAKGPNNTLWMNVYTNNGNSSVLASADISTDTPVVTKYAGTEGPTTQAELAVSPDGNRIWYTSGDKVGLLTLNDTTTTPPPVVDPPPPPTDPPPVVEPPLVGDPGPPKTIVDKILAPKTGIVGSALTILVVGSVAAGIVYERKRHEKNKIKAQSEK